MWPEQDRTCYIYFYLLVLPLHFETTHETDRFQFVLQTCLGKHSWSGEMNERINKTHIWYTGE